MASTIAGMNGSRSILSIASHTSSNVSAACTLTCFLVSHILSEMIGTKVVIMLSISRGACLADLLNNFNEVTLVCHLARSARPLSSPSRIKRFTKTGTAGAGTTSKTLLMATSASSRTSLLFLSPHKANTIALAANREGTMLSPSFFAIDETILHPASRAAALLLFKSSSTMMEVTSEETTSSEVVKASENAVMAVAPSSSTFFPLHLATTSLSMLRKVLSSAEKFCAVGKDELASGALGALSSFTLSFFIRRHMAAGFGILVAAVASTTSFASRFWHIYLVFLCVKLKRYGFVKSRSTKMCLVCVCVCACVVDGQGVSLP